MSKRSLCFFCYVYLHFLRRADTVNRVFSCIEDLICYWCQNYSQPISLYLVVVVVVVVVLFISLRIIVSSGGLVFHHQE